MHETTLVRCPSCDGYGWLDDEEGSEECGWCAGAGYVYRDASGVDRAIPPADYGRVAAQLEALEQERLREMGYSGEAKKPWEQAVRVEKNDGLLRRGGPDEEQARKNRPGQ
jgi:DnaJ-class molecular chaperone